MRRQTILAVALLAATTVAGACGGNATPPNTPTTPTHSPSPTQTAVPVATASPVNGQTKPADDKTKPAGNDVKKETDDKKAPEVKPTKPAESPKPIVN